MNTEDDEFARIAREQALNKMADNAHELGLDYEPAQQEPVEFKCMVIDNHHPNGIPFEQWVKPAQRKPWVGLTDEELDEMFSKTFKGKKLVNWVARAIETKLKEKNT